MKRIALGLGAAALVFALPVQAEEAAPWSINLHIVPQVPNYDCTDLLDADLSCLGIQSLLNETGNDVIWVLAGGVTNPAGIGGIQFGWGYGNPDGTPANLPYVASALCTGGSSIGTNSPDPVWPQGNGSGVAITWEGGCFNTPLNTDGLTKVFFWVVAGTTARCAWIQEHPVTDKVEGAFCDASVMRLAKQGFGTVCRNTTGCTSRWEGAGGSQCNKCGFEPADPVEDTSWGMIKALYN
jgi:hypothetical protein